MLLICTVLALAWANSPWADSYHRLWEIPLTIGAGSREPEPTAPAADAELLPTLHQQGGDDDGHRGGVVFTLSNATTGNAVLVFARAGAGSLAPSGSFATGGLDTGGGLGSQGALILSAATCRRPRAQRHDTWNRQRRDSPSCLPPRGPQH